MHRSLVSKILVSKFSRSVRLLGVVAAFALAAFAARAQSTSGSINGSVADPTGAFIPGATVTISNPVSGFTRTTTADAGGQFHFTNVPFNPYSVSVSNAGFQKAVKTVTVSSVVAVTLPVTLQIATSNTVVNVESAPEDLVETDPSAHTDIDRLMIDRMPMESLSSGLSSIVTQASPGVSADSDGQIHGLGDHAENSFSIDGQPITDQQSKVFSNQVPSAAVQSLEVIEGAPPAEYGDKTSLVIKATFRPGSDDPDRQRDAFGRQLWHNQPGVRPCVRRQELGKLYRRQRHAVGPLPRRSGICGDA